MYVGADRAGRHAGSEGTSWWVRIADIVAGLFELVCDLRERSAEAIDRKISGTTRSRRKAAVAVMSLGTAALVILMSTAVLDGEKHDALVAATQPVVRATMVGEDSSGCGALIELDGSEHEAVTSCGSASFAPGDTVWVARDPADPGRFLVVVAGEQWFVPGAVDRAMGVAFAAVLGPLVGIIGYLALLRLDAPSGRGRAKPRTLPDGAPGRSRPEPDASFLAEAEAGWEGFKASVGSRFERFTESDIRLRGSLMSLAIIVVLWAAAAMSLGVSRDLGADRAIVGSGPVVEAVLIDHGYKGSNPLVRYRNTRSELAYDPADGEGSELGDSVLVVVDPRDGQRLIPISMAAAHGPFAWFTSHGHLLLTGAGVLALAGYLLIGREIGDLALGVMRRLGPGS